MAVARLLSPKDFGLVGMVTGFIGVLSFMRDFGLSFAAVQRTTISDEQSWTLFWVNILIGVLLWLIAVAMAPSIAVFYSEPRLFAITAVMALGFLYIQRGRILLGHVRQKQFARGKSEPAIPITKSRSVTSELSDRMELDRPPALSSVRLSLASDRRMGQVLPPRHYARPLPNDQTRRNSLRVPEFLCYLITREAAIE